jgi:hypothetical protein
MYKLCNGKVLFFLRSLYFVCTYDDPLFSFAYYCKTVLVNYFGAVNDKLRGLVQYSWYIYRLTTKHIYLFIRVIYTFIVLVSSLCTYLILPFISPKKNVFVYCIIIEYLYSVYLCFFVCFLPFLVYEEQSCYALVVIIYLSPLNFRFFLFIHHTYFNVKNYKQKDIKHTVHDIRYFNKI